MTAAVYRAAGDLQAQSRLHQCEADPAPQPRPAGRPRGRPRCPAAGGGAARRDLAPDITGVATDENVDHPEIHDVYPAASVVADAAPGRRPAGRRRGLGAGLASPATPKSRQLRWLSPARIAAARRAAARGKNSAGP